LRSVSVSIALIILILQVAYALPQPCGVIGRIKVNGTYQDGIQVTVKNLMSGEEKTVVTQEIKGEHGW